MALFGSSTDVPVYIGVWTNWSQGRTAGITLTLTHQNAALLTAFLAVFITCVGASLWHIISFTIHQFLSSETPKDALYHQTQAVLRNSESGIVCLIHFLRILLAWRRRATRPFQRIIPLAIITALSTTAFAIASIFSARMVSGINNEVLLAGNSCGRLFQGDSKIVDSNMLSTIYAPYLSKLSKTMANYVDTCYTNVSEAEGCGFFFKRQLSTNIDRNASCPFHRRICRTDRNIKLDTGFISLGSDLGFNVPPDLQYSFRFVTQCAPLAVDGYKQIVNYSSEISYMRYLYGQTILNSDPIKTTNYSYEYKIPSVPQIKWEDFNTGWADYRLGTQGTYTYHGSYDITHSMMIPNDDLFQESEDLTLVFLSANDVTYSTQVDDPWYAAHRWLESFNLTGINVDGTVDAYLSDEPASTLGCKTQYQFCKPGSVPGEICPGSGGLTDMKHPDIPQTDRSYSIGPWIFPYSMDIGSVIQTLSTSALLSRNSLNEGIQAPFPDDQWQLEVEYWHNIALVSLQSIVTSTIGPDNNDIAKHFRAPPDSPEQKYLCKNQKIRSSAYSNYSVLKLTIVLVIGGLIIVMRYTLETLINVIETRVRRITKYSRLEWNANDILQTQRMAHESLGAGDPWEKCAGLDAVPVTAAKNQTLAVLDVRDPKHPRLAVSLAEKSCGDDAGKIVGSATPVRYGECGTGSEATEGGGRPSKGDPHPEKREESVVVSQDEPSSHREGA